MAASHASDPRSNTKVQEVQGGDAIVFASGSELILETGAKLIIADGDVTSTVTPGTVAGAASGYKLARSAAPVSLDGSNPTSFAHGLTTCVAVVVQLVGSAAPGDSTSVLTAVINGDNIDVYAWKPISGTDPTLVASTGTETFNWIAVGT